ncbi:GTP-binding protein [Candidatus Micrarchaeota archaeon]|nr:GTP-binding protein [Candidatus Micrarchaeota archaeon]
MASVLEQIRELEAEIAKTQKNKATEHHIGKLKAKIAKLRGNVIEKSKSKAGGIQFDVKKTGDASIALVGFPSVGKSSILNVLTDAKSIVAAYAFTTLDCIPGVMEYKGAKIQILDLPGILEGAYAGLGRGKEVLAVARGADMVLIVVDVFNPRIDVILNELQNIGIRVNQKPPNITIKKKYRGGININTTIQLTKINQKTVESIMNEYGVHSADVVFREDITVDQLIDVMTGNRVYLPGVAALNKADLVSEEYVKELQKKLGMELIPISAKTGMNFDLFREEIYQKLDFIRIFTRSRGVKKGSDDDLPMMLQRGVTVRMVCQKLHRAMLENFRYAQVWGKSAKHPGQKVGLDHILEDDDLVTIVTHTGYSR